MTSQIPVPATVTEDPVDPPRQTPVKGSTGERTSPLAAVGFLTPAAIVLGALVLWPIGYTLWRSMFDRSGDTFVGLDNYVRMFQDPTTLTAIKNNIIWVLVAPAIVTMLGLIFAVLTERIAWRSAFKLIVFMPMAISFLAAGIIFRTVYDQDPEKGLANAVVTSVRDVFTDSAGYPGARPRDKAFTETGGGYAGEASVKPGSAVAVPMVAVKPQYLPAEPPAALTPPESAEADDAISGTVWFDFTKGGRGEAGVVDEGEAGLGGMVIQARDVSGQVVGEATTDDDGSFTISGLDPGSSYAMALPESNFTAPFRGVDWLGPKLITPSIILAYLWMWAGFAMVLIAAGLAAIPRDALEAARVDGATEWQVFRRVTMPLLAPVLVVVFVTLVINVLKIFDLVYIIAPQSSQDEANVLAVQMWSFSFGGAKDEGMGSAVGIFLLLLVLPAMLFNIRRFRRENS